MEEESTDELGGLERGGLLLSAVGVVLEAEHDAVVVDLDEPLVGDRNAVNVAAEIPEDVLGVAARRRSAAGSSPDPVRQILPSAFSISLGSP